VEIQHAMMTRNEAVPVERRIQFRIGINLGDILIDDGDIFGDGVNIAARLETMADPGGICVSQAVVDQVRQKLDLKFEDLGSRALKNIEVPVRTYRILKQRTLARSTNARTDLADIVPGLLERPSVAIMPFQNLNPDAADDYIADGIGLGIQTLLVQLSGLFLINACSDQAYREGKVTAAEAMRELPVRYALEGAVQTAGQRIRVTAKLTNLKDNTVIWAERYDHDLEDVFTLQDDVTREVISSLSAVVLGADLNRIWTSVLTGRGAWEHFLRGVSHFYKFTKVDNALARQMFEKICELHPDKMIGPGYVGLTHWLDATRGWSGSRIDSVNEAATWAEKATVSDDRNNGLGHVVLGSVRLLERQFDEALALCRKGVGYRANCPFALGQLAAVKNYCGDARGAVKSAREALTVRTVYPPPLVNVLAMAYRDSGEVGLSIAAAREATRLDPKHTDAYVTLCTDFVLASDDDQARRTADEIIEIDPEFRISEYAKRQPYRDAESLSKIVHALRAAGLPE